MPTSVALVSALPAQEIDHPATDEHDTFYIKGGEGEVLLRTHTSTVQIREMTRRKPPLALISPGAVYRRDDDATHLAHRRSRALLRGWASA